MCVSGQMLDRRRFHDETWCPINKMAAPRCWSSNPDGDPETCRCLGPSTVNVLTLSQSQSEVQIHEIMGKLCLRWRHQVSCPWNRTKDDDTDLTMHARSDDDVHDIDMTIHARSDDVDWPEGDLIYGILWRRQLTFGNDGIMSKQYLWKFSRDRKSQNQNCFYQNCNVED